MRVLRPRDEGESWLGRLIWLLQSPLDFFAGPATPRPKRRVRVDEHGNVTPAARGDVPPE